MGREREMMYGEIYKDTLSPVICVIVRRHLSTLIRMGEELLKFQATSIWLLVINRIVDQFFPEFFRNGKVKNLSVIKIGKLVSKSINRKGGGTKKRTTPREINPFESLPPPL